MQSRPSQRSFAWGAVTVVLYHGLFLVAAVLLSPVLLWRLIFDARYRTGLCAWTGRVEETPAGRRCVWVHGVSVGEVKGAGPLLERIARDFPDCDLVVSTTTPTGQKLAKELYPEARVIYYPLDFGLFPRRALDRVRPSCVLLMELEIWPNFLQAAARREVPVVVINGRISESSFRGYRLVRPLLPQLNYIERYCVQNESYRSRLLALGVAAERIFVTGNMKYDGVPLRRVPPGAEQLRQWLSSDGRPVLVCGSTHGREDEWVAAAVAGLSASAGRAVRLVTVPRHPERSAAVRDALQGQGFRSVSWSHCIGSSLPPLADRDVVVVDTIGQLELFYSVCDVAFVGGSLVPHGGQNMIEPAALGKPVMFGPYTANFRAEVDLLIDADAAVRVANWSELEPTLGRLFAGREERDRIVARALDVIRSNQGATDRTYTLLEPLLGRHDGMTGVVAAVR